MGVFVSDGDNNYIITRLQAHPQCEAAWRPRSRGQTPSARRTSCRGPRSQEVGGGEPWSAPTAERLGAERKRMGGRGGGAEEEGKVRLCVLTDRN